MAETGRPGSGAAAVDEAAADEFRDIIRSRSGKHRSSPPGGRGARPGWVRCGAGGFAGV